MSRTGHFQTVQWGFLGRDGDEELLINGFQVTLGDRKVSPVVIAAQSCVVLHDTELCTQMVQVLSFMLYISYNNNGKSTQGVTGALGKPWLASEPMWKEPQA